MERFTIEVPSETGDVDLRGSWCLKYKNFLCAKYKNLFFELHAKIAKNAKVKKLHNYCSSIHALVFMLKERVKTNFLDRNIFSL